MAALLPFFLLSLNACLNDGGVGSSTSAKTNANAASTPISGSPSSGGTGADSLIQLTQVLKSQVSPDTSLDLIGDGSGTIGTFCVADGSSGGSSGSSTGSSTCTCAYNYSLPDGTTESFEAPTSYTEVNMIRCPYSSIPAGVVSVDVRIHVVNADTYSNTVTLSFSTAATTPAGGSAQAATDTSDPSMFLPVFRYQCADNPIITNLFDSHVYDQFQTQDKSVSYRRNFYTTNMGGAIEAIVKKSNKDDLSQLVNCMQNGTSLSSQKDAEMAVYSQTQDPTLSGGNAYMIFDPTQGATYTSQQNHRSNFYVARTPYGIFRTPVHAVVAPPLYVSRDPADQGFDPENDLLPLGYAAPATITSTGEVCPDNPLSPYNATTTIPPGYTWAKLWLERADLPIRENVASSTHLQQMGAILCNPGEWGSNLPNTRSDAAAYDGQGVPGIDESIFTDCAVNKIDNANLPDGPTGSWGSIGAAGNDLNRNGLSARVVASGDTVETEGYHSTLCLFPQDAAAGGNCAFAFAADTTCSNAASCSGTEPYTFNKGGAPTPVADSTVASNQFCAGGGADDSRADNYEHSNAAGAQTFSSAYPVFTKLFDGGTNIKPGNTGEIIDTTPDLVALDTESRLDYLFVVSPTSVMRNDMATEDTTAQPYLAYRFRTTTDCATGSAAKTDPSSCPTSPDVKFSYHLVATQLNANPNGSANDPFRTAVYPLCVLQKTQ